VAIQESRLTLMAHRFPNPAAIVLACQMAAGCGARDDLLLPDASPPRDARDVADDLFATQDAARRGDLGGA
jgi:hypothetical protein